MRERPILLNSEMVRAVLDGRKSQTRRIIKDCPIVQDGWYPDRYNNSEEWTFWGPRGSDDAGRCTLPFVKCPFGAVGDRLWVRENFYQHGRIHQPYLGEASDPEDAYFLGDKRVLYPADGVSMPPERKRDDFWRSRPSIHMPRWASRITLEIAAVRVERLQDISEADAKAEGVQQLRGGFWRHYNPEWTQHQLSARGSFATLWKSIYGEESWYANCWVWVIEFRRVEVSGE